MVSISRAAPAASRIWSVAFMISGPMPPPCATVIGVFVGINGIPSIVGLLYTLQQDPVVFFYGGTGINACVGLGWRFSGNTNTGKNARATLLAQLEFRRVLFR